MKRILLIIMLIPFLSYSQKTYVPDDIFEAYLESAGYGDSIPYNDSVNTTALLGVSDLSIPNLTISDLTGIEDMFNLYRLTAYGNNISTLPSFATLPFLYEINLSSNNLSSVDLSSMDSL